jgi:peptide-methionine (S)-S-oxide reductase
VIHTGVGYTGGARENPTYHALGDHAESIEIYYDPNVISYRELLEIFWKSHDPGARPWSRQYMSAIFYHNEEQKKLAFESLKHEETAIHKRVYTEILPAARFYPAEDYHQKYYLRQRPDLVNELRKIYPAETFVDSTAAARLNGFLAGHGSYPELKAELSDVLSPDEREHLLDFLGR